MNTATPIPLNELGLTDEQQKIVDTYFLHEEDCELSDSDLDQLCAMFDTPEKLKLIRKIFRVVSEDERGFTVKDPLSFLNESPADAQRYAVEVAVNVLAQSKIKGALADVYMRIRRYGQANMVAGFAQKNRDEYDEEQRAEENRDQEESETGLGQNL